MKIYHLKKSTYNTSKVGNIHAEKEGNYVVKWIRFVHYTSSNKFLNKTELRNAPHTILVYFRFLRIYNIEMLLKIDKKDSQMITSEWILSLLLSNHSQIYPTTFTVNSHALNFVTYPTLCFICSHMKALIRAGLANNTWPLIKPCYLFTLHNFYGISSY